MSSISATEKSALDVPGAAWGVVLSRLSGQQEVVIGTPVAGRTQTEIESLIGFFVNTQALRVKAIGSVGEVLRQVKERTLEAQEHQDLPFEQVGVVRVSVCGRDWRKIARSWLRLRIRINSGRGWQFPRKAGSSSISSAGHRA